MDTQTAYGRPQPTFDATLVQVGPGTPAGDECLVDYAGQKPRLSIRPPGARRGWNLIPE